MGLDYVELIMATEETFGIEITDEEAQDAITPGKLLDVVMSKIQTVEDAACLTQQAFYLFRRRCIQILGTKRNDIRPVTKLTELIPRQERVQKWGQLKYAVGASQWPELLRSRALTGGIVALSCAAFVVTGMYVQVADIVTLIECSAVAWITAWVCLASTRRLKWNYPSEVLTAGDVAKFLASRQPGLLRQDPRSWNREIAWQRLCNLISEQLGVTEFDENSRFIEDMKIG